MTSKCSVCGKGFYRKKQLYGHMARAHKTYENQPVTEVEYKCPKCGKIFSNNASLIGHSGVHARRANKSQVNENAKRAAKELEDSIKRVESPMEFNIIEVKSPRGDTLFSFKSDGLSMKIYSDGYVDFNFFNIKN